MDWDQIESKWAAMTRRVCGGMPAATADTSGKPKRPKAKADASTTNGNVDLPANITGSKQTAMLAQ